MFGLRNQLSKQQKRGLARLVLRCPDWRERLPSLAAKNSVVAKLCQAYENSSSDLCQRDADGGQADNWSRTWLIDEIEDEIGLWLEALDVAPKQPACP